MRPPARPSYGSQRTAGLVTFAGLAQVVVPTVGALFWRRASVAGATAGLVVGVTTLVLFTALPATIPGPFAVGGGGLLSLLLNIVVFVLVSLVTKPRDSALLLKLSRRTRDFNLERWDAPDTEADTRSTPETARPVDLT